jgi:mRNA interferase RelE/StbE
MYRLIFTKKAMKQMASLDRYVQKKIQDYLNKNVSNSADPRQHGKGPSENLAGYWRYRIGDYRVICRIEDNVCEVIAVNIGHRSKVYS